MERGKKSTQPRSHAKRRAPARARRTRRMGVETGPGGMAWGVVGESSGRGGPTSPGLDEQEVRGGQAREHVANSRADGHARPGCSRSGKDAPSQATKRWAASQAGIVADGLPLAPPASSSSSRLARATRSEKSSIASPLLMRSGFCAPLRLTLPASLSPVAPLPATRLLRWLPFWLDGVFSSARRRHRRTRLQVGPVHIGAQRFKSDNPSRFTLKTNAQAFPQRTSDGYRLAQIAHRSAAASRKRGLICGRHAVQVREQLTHAAHDTKR